MSTINPNQFSIKIKVPQSILFHKSERLATVFQDIIDGYIGKGNCRVTARCYLVSLKCRFTAIFNYVPKHPDNIRCLIEKVAKRTIISILTE